MLDAPATGALPQSTIITVHVAGEVVAPGLVTLVPGARVADAIAAAGGVLPGGRLDQLNLAAPVRDGEQIVIPTTRESPGGREETDDGLVDVNSAAVAELENLPGVGPVLALRIAAHREAHGPFARVEDLLDVPGIGEAKLAGLRDFAFVR